MRVIFSPHSKWEQIKQCYEKEHTFFCLYVEFCEVALHQYNDITFAELAAQEKLIVVSLIQEAYSGILFIDYIYILLFFS